ncbi:ATP-binding protein [Sphingomonas sp. SUN039]|uniref:ATP-binding protein n=1 Tax=Sphingomonas sp. SUN039 TaxID=2937787 RepID=UPI0021640404|nr:hypothetical protein [Sphingomonas sp. SUN039]UVO53760.1 hypothetical protein M0209_06345 [Sphingomonas sp. SUN039]
MDPMQPEPLITDDLTPFFGAVPQGSSLLHYAISGFEVPSLPALAPESGTMRNEVTAAVLYRFRAYIAELHQAGRNRSIALQFSSDPDASRFNARVRCHMLMRSAHSDPETAKREARDFAAQAMQTFPQEGMFSYGSPRWMNKRALQLALFQLLDPEEDKNGKPIPVAQDERPIKVVEIRKWEQALTSFSQPSMHYVPHRYWADNRRDPWLSIVETLAKTAVPTAVRIELQPVQLAEGQGREFVALAGRWFSIIAEDLTRKASQGDKEPNKDGIVTEEMMRADLVATASSDAAAVSYIHRGRHIYERLTSYSDSVFVMRVTLAAREAVPEALIGSVRSALANPPPDDPDGALGWVRPRIVRPGHDEMEDAVESLRWMTQSRWARGEPNAASAYKIDLSGVVTPDEAVSLFHLPIYDRPGQTSALSTAEAPFVIPPDSLDAGRFKQKPKVDENGKRRRAEKKDLIKVGYLYQRENLLGEDKGDGALPFMVSLGDLLKPSLLVGAPGSGKTNLAFSLLLQLWRDHDVPFLVLDPSTGQEFRMLMGNEKLENDLVVYTVGDLDECPLQFNPFSVPPGVTVRNHTTRILAAFRAAFQMFDPVPAIYEGALERIYTDPRYLDGQTPMRMDQKGGPDTAAPTLAAFAAAIRDEVNEKAVSLYEGSKESIGVIRGASTIRVNAIGKKIGHIINVKGNNGAFIQQMLKRPVVIELGGLGDGSNIALVMAFFLTQLAGHIEEAFRKDTKRIHIMFIEEAHRLLGAGEGNGVESKSAEDLNTMLAEVRKFGQGILVMDQRPSSLVGGVLDNSYVKILTRLSDRQGFDRLASELNLNEAQQRYARTRLKTGDAIMIDRDAGQPVLMRSEDAKSGLEPPEPENEAAAAKQQADLVAKMQANAKSAKLEPPLHVPYVEPGASDGKTGTADLPAAEWLAGEAKAAFEKLLNANFVKSGVWHAMNTALGEGAGVDAAIDALGPALEGESAAFDAAVGDLWEKLKWGLVGRLAEERYKGPLETETRDRRGEAAGPPRGTSNAAADPTGPFAGLAATLATDLATLEDRSFANQSVWWSVKDRLWRTPPDRKAAGDAADSVMTAERAGFDALTAEMWRRFVVAVVARIEDDPVSDEKKAQLDQRAVDYAAMKAE